MSTTEPVVARPDAVRDQDGDAPFAQLADELLTAMASIRRSGRAVAGRPTELSALTTAQIDLVRLVRRRPGVSVGEAADSLRLAANTVSTLVGQLTEGGLLSRTLDPADRRVARLELTGDMRQKVGAFRDRRISMLATAMEGLSPDALERAVGTLRLLAERLPDRLAPDAGA
jgi:DNA-binding MarR family transcriptional regulator